MERMVEHMSYRMSLEEMCVDGENIQIYLPEIAQKKERINFVNTYCEFSPTGWMQQNGIFYPLAYKVVTDDLNSLGLRRNPNIIHFPLQKWIELDQDQVVPGMDDYGGIWSALRKSSIKTLKAHCLNTWGMQTRGFLVAIKNPVYANTYRIKSQGVILLKEI